MPSLTVGNVGTTYSNTIITAIYVVVFTKFTFQKETKRLFVLKSVIFTTKMCNYTNVTLLQHSCVQLQYICSLKVRPICVKKLKFCKG